MGNHSKKIKELNEYSIMKKHVSNFEAKIKNSSLRLEFLEYISKLACECLYQYDSDIKIHEAKKTMLLVILILFFPMVLSGERLKNNSRNRISKILKCDCTTTSHYIRLVIFLYEKYPDFSSRVDHICEKIISGIESGEINFENA